MKNNLSGSKGPEATPMPEKAYWTEHEVAARLGMSRKWLQKTRYNGTGIPFFKIGGSIKYAIADVLAFEAECRGGEQ